MKKAKTKFFASPLLIIVAIITIILVVGFWVFSFLYPWKGGGDITQLGYVLIIPIVFAGVFPIIILIAACDRGFSVLEISKNGIKKTLFGAFRKREISWDELFEIRCCGFSNMWICFSKGSLKNVSHDRILKRKDVIQIQLSRAVVKSVKEHTNKEIINLPIKR